MQRVAHCGRDGEELLGGLDAYGVPPLVLRAGAAEAVAVEAGTDARSVHVSAAALQLCACSGGAVAQCAAAQACWAPGSSGSCPSGSSAVRREHAQASHERTLRRLCTLCEPASAADDVPRRLHERASSFRPLHPGECASVPLRAAEHRVTVQERPAHEREHERETQHGPTGLLPLMREGIADDEQVPKSRRYFMCRSGV